MKDPITKKKVNAVRRRIVKPKKKANLPEAPASVTIRAFYKGYSVLLTNRDENVRMRPLLRKAINAINWMDLNDFKPSWNEPKGQQSFVKQDQKDQKTCPHAHTVVKVSHSEKNPDREFKYCTDCRGFAGWVE